MDVPQWLNASSFQYRTQGSGRHVSAGVAGNGDRARLAPMLELTMAPARSNEPPTILVEQSQQLAHFHL
jgi:hypothetical protein